MFKSEPYMNAVCEFGNSAFIPLKTVRQNVLLMLPANYLIHTAVPVDFYEKLNRKPAWTERCLRLTECRNNMALSCQIVNVKHPKPMSMPDDSRDNACM